jgi:hypothetical protein
MRRSSAASGSAGCSTSTIVAPHELAIEIWHRTGREKCAAPLSPSGEFCADFVVVPDIVAGGLASLEWSAFWRDTVPMEFAAYQGSSLARKLATGHLGQAGAPARPPMPYRARRYRGPRALGALHRRDEDRFCATPCVPASTRMRSSPRSARRRNRAGANCDHSRSMPARTQVRMRETLGKRIRHLEHKRGSRSRLQRAPLPLVPGRMRRVASTHAVECAVGDLGLHR